MRHNHPIAAAVPAAPDAFRFFESPRYKLCRILRFLCTCRLLPIWCILVDTRLFKDITPVAARGRRTDRLILSRLLDAAARLTTRLPEEAMRESQKRLIRWADLESSGRLHSMNETQMQGDFLREVFGDALHYIRALENVPQWNLEQHWPIPGNGTPDGIIGNFTAGAENKPDVVIELKGPLTHLDRDRSDGRNAVQQCWDYFAHLPTCRWGIVSNIVSFRLYERNHSPRRYEHFALQELRDLNTFKQFYTLFEKTGLLGTTLEAPKAASLLAETDNRQEQVGDRLYDKYSTHRLRLIRHLRYDRDYSIDHAIAIAQQLIDRIIFIAFCEDRELLKHSNTLERTWREIPSVSLATNPRWKNFAALFRGIDQGNERDLGLAIGYNGGLFARSATDDLDLDDDWTDFFKEVGEYDFRDEVNLEVLGHLFEKSITELEKLREGDYVTRMTTITGAPDVRSRPEMPKSALRKRMGIYYTPPALTERIVQLAVDDLIRERFAAVASNLGLDADRADTLEYWIECLQVLRNLKVCDPACGSGAFLFQAYEVLESRYGEVIDALERHQYASVSQLADEYPDIILQENLYGIDLSREAVEITQLALWIRSARRGRTLANLSHNIHWGNSLVRDPSVHERAFAWEKLFPEVFSRTEAGFDCVIGNPPWERMKLQEREFFSLSAPEIATATNAANRRKLIEKLPKQNPELFERYQQAIERAQSTLDYARQSGEYPLTGRGDINTYAVFAELAFKIVAAHGRVGLLVPSGIATDSTTQDFFATLTDEQRLICLYDFENRRKLFPDVDGRFKFSIIVFGGRSAGRQETDFMFFAHQVEELEDRRRHIVLSADDIRLLNPNTRTCPIFRTRRDAEITKRIYRNVPVLIDRNRERGGNPWGIRFKTMFHQTNDAELFHEAGYFLRNRYSLKGNRWVKGKNEFLPVYEAKMVQMYDHRAAGVIVDESNWVRQGQTTPLSLVDHQNPERLPLPRFWIKPSIVAEQYGDEMPCAFIAFKDVTSATNQRTMIAAFIPPVGVVNSAPLVLTNGSRRVEACLLGNLNSIVYDFVARQKVGSVHLNFFIVEQVATLSPEKYSEKCPWDRRKTLEAWISERVLKLTCTADDMLPLAEACEFTGGDIKDYGGKLHRWNPADRAKIMAELDAAYFHLYGIDREDAAYILTTFSGVDDPTPGLPGNQNQAQRILDTYDWLAAHIR